MMTFIGVFITIVGLVAWLGQTISFVAPGVAQVIGLLESKDEMNDTFYIIESKVLCLNDMLFSWTLPLAGILLLVENAYWPYVGLIGGGIYLYFSGFILISRFYLKREGKQIGPPSGVITATVFSMIWIFSSILMIILSIDNLSQ